jgi:hypothetical protein
VDFSESEEFSSIQQVARRHVRELLVWLRSYKPGRERIHVRIDATLDLADDRKGVPFAVRMKVTRR